MPAEPSSGLPAAASKCPPSAKLVLYVLMEKGESTQGDLVAETRLPQRTVQDALARLETVGLVSSRPDLRDTRRLIYTVTADA